MAGDRLASGASIQLLPRYAPGPAGGPAPRRRHPRAGLMRVLYVGYPLLPVSGESCGGAEQMLWTLEAEMARRGHETRVAACDGSRVAGQLLPTGAAATQPDQF